MSEYIERLQKRLSAEQLTALEARDGILESYVVANRKAVKLGVTDFAINAEDDDVFNRILDMMRELFKERGANADNPSVRDLRSVRHTLDLKLRLTELPVEIRETHDVCCEMILEKTVEAESSEEPIDLQGFETVSDRIPASTDGAQAEAPAEPAPAVPESPFEVEKKEEAQSVQPTAEPETQPSEPFSAQPVPSQAAPAEQAPPAAAPAAQAPQASQESIPEFDVKDIYSNMLDNKLRLERLSPEDARDGIIESLVIVNREAIDRINYWAAIKASDAEVESRVRKMMREFFAEQMADFDDPDLLVLEMAKSFLEAKLQIAGVPEELKTRHEESCRNLLEKAHNLVDSFAEAGESKPSLSLGSFKPREKSIFAAEHEEVPQEAVPFVDEPAPAESQVSPTEFEPALASEKQEETIAEQPVFQEAEVPIARVMEPVEAESTPVETAPPEPVQATPVDTTAGEQKVQIPIEELIARIRGEVEEIVNQAVSKRFAAGKAEAGTPHPPSGVAAEVSGDMVFLAWLDSAEQPGYYVYEKSGEHWIKLTAIPLSRPSFTIRVDKPGERIFAVSAISTEGNESELSPPVILNI